LPALNTSKDPPGRDFLHETTRRERRGGFLANS
jgi:hypothetical protein